jgi:hypothetical protein
MRGSLLLSAALFGAVIAALALAQTTSTPPTPPGSSETAAPASTNHEPPTGKPTESGPESTQGASGGPGNTQATAPGPGSNAPSASPAPGGTAPGPASSSSSNGSPAPGRTPKELATGTQTKKPVSHGATSQTHSHGHAAHPRRSETKHSSNVGRPHRRPLISPHPPTTSVDENASADQHLRDAQTALSRHRTEEAEEALERAETRALNDAPEGNVSQNSTVITIERAREALGHVRYLRSDPAQAGQLIDQALSQTTGSSALSGTQ